MLLIYKLNPLLIIIIHSVNNIFLNTVYAKNLNRDVNINQQHIEQLHQISNAHSECLIQIQQQLSEDQQNINILRGHIQDIQHQILKIEHHQKESYNKLNNTLDNYNHAMNTIHNNNNQSTTISEVKIHDKIINRENTNTTINNDHEYAYKQAVSLVLEKKQYDQAIQSFQNFIKNYPNSNYQANAHYWLGQLFYNKNNKHQASYYFALVTKHYPKSLKAPDALLKIGIIMQETNQKDKAKIIYKQINKLYPDSNAAKQAQKHLIHL